MSVPASSEAAAPALVVLHTTSASALSAQAIGQHDQQAGIAVAAAAQLALVGS